MFRRRSLFISLLVLTPLATVAGSAHAQASQDEVDRWHSQLEFGFTGASGNTSFSILTAAASLDRLERDQFELHFAPELDRLDRAAAAATLAAGDLLTQLESIIYLANHREMSNREIHAAISAALHALLD